jgi:hypothetical protein
MSLFKNETAQGVWISHWCERCYRGQHIGDPAFEQCSILAKALGHDRKPPEWDRNSKPPTMSKTYKCNEFRRHALKTKPPKVQQFEDVSMFDDDTLMADGRFVPVAGWPDKPKKGKETDHA